MNANKKYRIPITIGLLNPDDKVSVNTYLDDIANAIATSSGSYHASRIVITDSSGKIDNSLIPNRRYVVTGTGYFPTGNIKVVTGSAGNYGAYAEITTGYSSAISILGFSLYAAGVANDGDIVLGKGTAGSESVISTFPFNQLDTDYNLDAMLPYGIDLSASVRCAVKAKATLASQTYYLSIINAFQSDIQGV